MGLMDRLLKRRPLVDVAAELEAELANVEGWETEVEKLTSELDHAREMLREAQQKFENKRAELFAQHPALDPQGTTQLRADDRVVASRRDEVIIVDDDTPPDPLAVGRGRVPDDSFDEADRVDFDER